MPVSRNQILDVFTISRERGTATGFRIRGRNTILISLIEDITGDSQDSTFVSIKEQSIYGEFIEDNRLKLADIEAVFPLRVKYNDPFYAYLRSLRTNIRSIRTNAGLVERPLISVPRRISGSVSEQ